MLGSRRAISFWRAKRPLLSLERALTPLRQRGGKAALPAEVLAVARARGRLQAESRKKGRFAEN